MANKRIIGVWVAGLVLCFGSVRAAAPLDMAYIPAGLFQMGTELGEGGDNERPFHAVQLNAFFMDKFEVSHAWWTNVKLWADSHGYCFENAGAGLVAGDNPKGPDMGTSRVVRGGGWCSMTVILRCAYRVDFTPDGANDVIGFRCVRGL
jgi:formylglycine-generating enzyme required for sulfatase activity